MFSIIRSIEDVRPHVAHKQEFKFRKQSNGVTIGHYDFVDSKSFDTPESLECRGVAFDADGYICSRPLHKFFNLGEKEYLQKDQVLARSDLVGVYEKLDGSMIATAWVDGRLELRSRKRFDNAVTKLAWPLLLANPRMHEFACIAAENGYTSIFELTHPEARIVCNPGEAQLQLLHVRNNVNGEYSLLQDGGFIRTLAYSFNIPTVERHDLTMDQAIASLERMTHREGYVFQFADGTLVKVKCPWYVRLHTCVTFLRERDVARLALTGELDDVRAGLRETGHSLEPVDEVASKVKDRLISLQTEVDALCEDGNDRNFDAKAFALANNKHPLFGLAARQFRGQEINLPDWFLKNRLREEFGLRQLGSDALIEACT